MEAHIKVLRKAERDSFSTVVVVQGLNSSYRSVPLVAAARWSHLYDGDGCRFVGFDGCKLVGTDVENDARFDVVVRSELSQLKCIQCTWQKLSESVIPCGCCLAKQQAGKNQPLEPARESQHGGVGVEVEWPSTEFVVVDEELLRRDVDADSDVRIRVRRDPMQMMALHSP
mmetsp:Transcript_24609/g.37439  ORF Transcript_24609/g.37439 Transcript_24609/m.37439 type:complete len:171 (+) Transcript_24609:728-1240(+)